MIDSKENYKFDLGVEGLRCSSGKKSYQTVFFNKLSLNVPYHLPMLVSKNTTKRIGHHACLIHMTGQTYPIHACTCTNHACHFIGFQLVEVRVLKGTFEKELISRKS